MHSICNKWDIYGIDVPTDIFTHIYTNTASIIFLFNAHMSGMSDPDADAALVSHVLFLVSKSW